MTSDQHHPDFDSWSRGGCFFLSVFFIFCFKRQYNESKLLYRDLEPKAKAFKCISCMFLWWLVGFFALELICGRSDIPKIKQIKCGGHLALGIQVEGLPLKVASYTHTHTQTHTHTHTWTKHWHSKCRDATCSHSVWLEAAVFPRKPKAFRTKFRHHEDVEQVHTVDQTVHHQAFQSLVADFGPCCYPLLKVQVLSKEV